MNSRLNRRLLLEAPVETADGAGGVTRAYEAAGVIWASAEVASARADASADAPGATLTHRFTVRWRPDLTTRHRLHDGARLFRIVAIRPVDGRFLTIDAEEHTA